MKMEISKFLQDDLVEALGLLVERHSNGSPIRNITSHHHRYNSPDKQEFIFNDKRELITTIINLESYENFLSHQFTKTKLAKKCLEYILQEIDIHDEANEDAKFNFLHVLREYPLERIKDQVTHVIKQYRNFQQKSDHTRREIKLLEYCLEKVIKIKEGEKNNEFLAVV